MTPASDDERDEAGANTLALSSEEFDAFHDAHGPALWGYVRRSTGDEHLAADIFQETMLRFLRRAPRELDDARRKAYVFQIASNLMRDAWRAAKREERRRVGKRAETTQGKRAMSWHGGDEEEGWNVGNEEEGGRAGNPGESRGAGNQEQSWGAGNQEQSWGAANQEQSWGAGNQEQSWGPGNREEDWSAGNQSEGWSASDQDWSTGRADAASNEELLGASAIDSGIARSDPSLDVADRVALSRDLERALATLRPIERQLVWLAHVEGLSHRELGNMLGLEEGSVKVMLFRARKKLAASLQPERAKKEGSR